MDELVLSLRTDRRTYTDLTGAAREFCQSRGSGLLNVFVPHATAGVAVIELGSGTEDDLSAALERLLPVDDIYRHRHGSYGHGRDHVVPAFVAPSITVPVQSGRMRLGTWQSLVLVDTNRDNPERQVVLSFLASAGE